MIGPNQSPSRRVICRGCGFELLDQWARGGTNFDGGPHTCPSLPEARRWAEGELNHLEEMWDHLEGLWQKQPPDPHRVWIEAPWILRDQYLRLVERYEAGLVQEAELEFHTFGTVEAACRDDLPREMYSFIHRVRSAVSDVSLMREDAEDRERRRVRRLGPFSPGR